MDIQKYINKKLKIIFYDGASVAKKVGVINWVGAGFIEVEENGTKSILPIKSLIRLEVVE